MKLLLLLSAIPYGLGEAIEVVSREVVRLMAAAGHDVYVQVLIREGRSQANAQREQAALEEFSGNARVHLLPSIYLGDMGDAGSRLRGVVGHGTAILRSLPLLRRWINPYFFPAMVAGPLIRSRVENIRPAVIASIWSWEALAASYDVRGVPKFVYYGNPNHKPHEAQYRFPELFGLPSGGVVNGIKLRVLKLLNRAREIQHVRMMAACEVTANNALIDATYYTQMGHPRSLYLQNMWPDAPGGPVFGGRPIADGMHRICASVGNLAATGNTFGLHYLGKELAPRLEARLGRERLLIEVFGGGTARPAVAKYLQHPCIRLRGWVDDLNAQIVAAPIFLVLTNCYGFNVGNTRILLAWSLGVCVIAHTSSALSMPELVHGESALLGDTPAEIADLVVQALTDPGLRERIGRGGYEAFQKHYRSETVVPRMLEVVEQLVQESMKRGNPEYVDRIVWNRT